MEPRLPSVVFTGLDLVDGGAFKGSLTSVALLGNKFDDATVEMLLKLKKEKPALTTLCGIKADQIEAN